MDWKKINVQIVVPDKVKKILFLVIGTWICVAFACTVLDYLSIEAYRVGKLITPVLTALPAIIVFRKEKRSFRSLFFGKAIRQIIIGIVIAALLLVMIGIINNGIKWNVETSLFNKYNWYKIYIIVYYVLIIGFTEEFIYRVVIQESIDELLPKYKFLVPLISAMIFGLAHYAVGGWKQVMMTFLLGIVWGYVKYYIKDANYLAVSISHGLYDFGLLIVPMLATYI